MSLRLTAAALVLAPVLVAVSAEAGGWLAVHGALADAATLDAQGDYAAAYGVDAALAGRSGPQYGLAHGGLVAAGDAAVATLEHWADALAAQQRPDDAVAVLDRIPAARVDAGVRRRRARLLLQGAQAAQSAGHPELALERLASLLSGAPPTDIAAQGVALRRTAEVGAAGGLLDVWHRPAEAVAELDLAMSGADPADAAAAQAGAKLPAALLAAGQQLAAQADTRGALADLQRLVGSYAHSPQAATARTLLAAPQPVCGTVVLRDGTPISGRVRLSTHFVKLASGYRTAGPFFPGLTDSAGDFTLTGIPQGGGYVLEVLLDGGWTTLVDGDAPANPVTVAPMVPTDMSYVVMPG